LKSNFNIVKDKLYFGVDYMKEEKITLPKETQRQMMKFFLKTSIPKIKKEKLALLSEKKSDGSKE